MINKNSIKKVVSDIEMLEFIFTHCKEYDRYDNDNMHIFLEKDMVTENVEKTVMFFHVLNVKNIMILINCIIDMEKLCVNVALYITLKIYYH